MSINLFNPYSSQYHSWDESKLLRGWDKLVNLSRNGRPDKLKQTKNQLAKAQILLQFPDGESIYAITLIS